MVPEGWHAQSVGDLCDFVNGNGFKSSEWSAEGLPIIRIQNLNGSKDFNHFNGEARKKWIVEPGDILFAWAGTKGVSFGAKRWSGPKGVLNQHIFRIEPKQKIDRNWLYFTLVRVTEHVENKAHGFKATLLHVQKSDITEQVIAAPPVKEQKKIAKILSTWDEAIATTEQLLANSEQQKKALMQQLLTGKKRLPGFEGEWSEVTLGEIFSERKEAGITNLPLLSVTSDQGIINRDDVGRKDTSSADKSKYLRVCPGDIAYNTMRMWQGVSALSRFEGIVSPAYTVLKPKDGVDSRFAAYLFKLPRMIHRFYRHSQGLVSDTWNLKYKQFAKIKVVVPDVEEQKAIAEVLSKEDKIICRLEEQLKLLAFEKKALMQQLLTGKRRVRIDEAECASA